MSKSLGKLLQSLRKKQEINQKVLSRGICSVTTLSRIEAGERQPDYLLFDALLTRLGKDSRKWEFILKENDRNLLERRNEIESLFHRKAWNEIEKEIENYIDFSEVSKNLHQQYKYMIQGILCAKKGNLTKALETYQKALEKTNLEINVLSLHISDRISRNELEILCLIGQILLEEEQTSLEVVEQYWKELLRYIEKNCTDEWYQTKFYIRSVYYLSDTLYRRGNYMESFLYCEKGIKRLVEKMSLYYLKSFLYLLKELQHKGINPVINGIQWRDKIPFFINILEE